MIHKHHIVPRHAGGTDDPSNLVELTVQEHADAHNLLWHTYHRYEDRLAEWGLLGMVGKEDIIEMNNKLQASRTHKGVPKTKEHNQKVSDALTGLAKTNEHKDALAMSRSGGGYEITHPDGQIEFVPNLSRWCRDNNQSRDSFKQLLKMPERTHQRGGRKSKLRELGWSIRKIN